MLSAEAAAAAASTSPSADPSDRFTTGGGNWSPELSPESRQGDSPPAHRLSQGDSEQDNSSIARPQHQSATVKRKARSPRAGRLLDLPIPTGPEWPGRVPIACTRRPGSRASNRDISSPLQAVTVVDGTSGVLPCDNELSPQNKGMWRHRDRASPNKCPKPASAQGDENPKMQQQQRQPPMPGVVSITSSIPEGAVMPTAGGSASLPLENIAISKQTDDSLPQKDVGIAKHLDAKEASSRPKKQRAAVALAGLAEEGKTLPSTQQSGLRALPLPAPRRGRPKKPRHEELVGLQIEVRYHEPVLGGEPGTHTVVWYSGKVIEYDPARDRHLLRWSHSDTVPESNAAAQEDWVDRLKVSEYRVCASQQSSRADDPRGREPINSRSPRMDRFISNRKKRHVIQAQQPIKTLVKPPRHTKQPRLSTTDLQNWCKVSLARPVR
eukprot:SAG31_NODE_661_length_13035_cov_12.057591_13_plen_438_part_00